MDLYQQPHRYMRPPPPLLPPSMADPYHNQQLGQRPSGPPPQGPWFSNQFQYHHPSHSPSPPPPPPSPWGPPPPPPPPPASAGSYPPPPHPYPAQYIQHNQFPPLPPQPPPPHRPHMAPHFPPHSQIPQPYSQVKQDWGNQNWAPPPQSWDYSGQNNEEDWAARARAWADAKAAMENQNSQSHYAPEQYQQAKSSHYSDAAHQSLPPSSYEQFPVAASPLNQLPGSHQQESASIGTEPPSFVPDELQHYPARDGGLGKDANAGFHHQGNLPSSSSVNQQEVPSSYSSVTGKEVMADQNEHSYRLFPARNSSSQEGQQHLQPSFPPSYAYGNQSVDPMHNPADQPLEFAPRFGHDHDLQMHSNYAHHDSVGPGRGMDSINTWTPPAVPGMVYPPMPSGFPSAPQHAPSIALPSVSGHNPPPFGSFPGQGLPSAIPSGATPFPLTAGTALPTTAFPGDTYGISNMIERPKKAPVPNWLREEIKKAVITGSSVDHPKEETQFIEDEGLDNSFTKGDQADSKSVDSPRSTEEEDDEDEVEAAKTAAINLEIKRVLTEVLLKVTDELFDEIATKVLDEDDSSAPATRKIVTSNQKEATFALSAPTPKASAKVLIPVKPKEQELDTDGSNKSSSNSAGNVLGLANYDSDEDDGKGNGEIQSLKMSDSSKNDHLQHSSTIKLAEKMHVAVGIGSSQVDLQEHGDLPTNINNSVKTSLNEFRNTNSTAISKVNGDMVDEEKEHTSNSDTNGRDNEIKVSGTISRSKEASGSTEFKTPKETLNEKESSKSHRGKETKVKLDKDDRHESWTSSSVKDDLKDVKETAKTKKDEIGDENRRRQDERHLRKEKNSDGQKLSKERKKDDEIKHGERANESGSKKRSTHSETRDDRKETDGSQRSSAKDITDIRREQTKGKEEERSSRQKCSGDSRRHKSKRSPSNSTRGRSSKENSASHANSSSDSDDSRRKPRSRKRNSSPSPVRSKRRQVSRSPHSKHSQRRHSPYSSLDSTRGRRSRSRSPVRRKR